MKNRIITYGLMILALGLGIKDTPNYINLKLNEITSIIRKAKQPSKNLEESLRSLLNKDGTPVFKINWGIDEFIRVGGTYEDAVAFSQIKDNYGKSIFDGVAMSRFKEKEGTLEEAVLFASIKDADGNPVFDGPTISGFKWKNISFDYVKNISNVRNVNGNPVFSYWSDFSYFHDEGISDAFIAELADIKDGDRNPYFTNKYDISKLWDSKFSLKFIKNLTSIRDKEGNPIFTAGGICAFYENNGSFEYAKSLSNIKNKRGNSLFTGEDIWIFKVYNVPVEYVEVCASIKDKYENQLFNRRDITDFFENGVQSQLIVALSDIKDNDDDVVFDKEDILKLVKDGFSKYEDFSEYATILKKFSDNSGKRIFSGWDIYKSVISGRQINDLIKWAEVKDKDGKNIFNGKEIYRFAQLGITLDDALGFKDTRKPNAVIVYPMNDWNSGFENEAAINFFKSIKEHYDVWVKIAATEDEVYDAISYVPNIELLILSGHGSKTTLSLGEADLRVREAEKDESYTIDTIDTELKKYLKQLNPNAVIFLNACSTAEGGEGKSNLTNTIAKMANGRKVFGSLRPFTNIKINAVYPLEIEIVNGDSILTYSKK